MRRCLAAMRLFISVFLILISGCSHNVNPPRITLDNPSPRDNEIVVPADQDWVDTGIDVALGEILTVVGRGKIVVRHLNRLKRRKQIEVGAIGTYFFDDDVVGREFPLPSAGRGPAPCYCLIGRIGDGPLFYVGRQRSWEAEQAGRLKLGINDFDFADNNGQFFAQVTKPQRLQPVGFEELIPPTATDGQPKDSCTVVVFYVDGLRPDIIREMSAMGHLPTISKVFLEDGVRLSNTFTAFPSDTITSNGTMWTGCFSDRHGLKEHIRFSRRRLVSESYLESLGPNRCARLLSPQGVDNFVQTAQAVSLKLVRGDNASRRWWNAKTTGIPPIYEHLRAHGLDWATGVLPMMTELPPLLWTRSMTRQMPYFHVHQVWRYIDDANALYAVRHSLDRACPVTVIWLPETDSVSHKHCRGQFGMTRRTIAQADVLIKQIIAELEAVGRLNKTYLILVSDHGHHGGRTTHLSHFDVANEVFFKAREVSIDGRWNGGGLGLSVRQHRFHNRHKGDSRRDFVFIDADTDGVARIFLPRKSYRSKDWSGPNRPGDLLAYRVSDDLSPVDLVGTLAVTRAIHGNGEIQYPVDLVLMKLSDRSILITTANRGQAVVERRRDQSNRWIYRYAPVTAVRPTSGGGVTFQFIDNPAIDPLNLLECCDRKFFNQYHDEQTWLRVTAETAYPDSVVALTRHMLWQKNLEVREFEYAPDLVITANPGWYFGNKGTPGTMHGYPFSDSMRATWFVSGPNIRRGARIDVPCRLVDLTPTILDMVGVSVDPDQFDGTALRTIYDSDNPGAAAAAFPVYWRDVDLRAWQSLQYSPLERYEHLPLTVNHPSSPFDLNNIAFNILTISELSVFRLFDDILSPLSMGEDRLTRAIEQVDQRIRHVDHNWVVEGAQAIDFPDIALSDYSITSLGNLKRVDGIIDWIQKRSLYLDKRLSKPIGRCRLPGSQHVHQTIDTAQLGFWELYRFTQRLLIEFLDEMLLNGFEDHTDRVMNSFRALPSEVIVNNKEENQRER